MSFLGTQIVATEEAYAIAMENSCITDLVSEGVRQIFAEFDQTGVSVVRRIRDEKFVSGRGECVCVKLHR